MSAKKPPLPNPDREPTNKTAVQQTAVDFAHGRVSKQRVFDVLEREGVLGDLDEPTISSVCLTKKTLEISLLDDGAIIVSLKDGSVTKLSERDYSTT